jgi:hydrogenase/urease accessory protein HupE
MRIPTLLFLAVLVLAASYASAHMLVDNAMDVVVGPQSVSVEVRISLDELTMIEAHGIPANTEEEWQPMIDKHRAYVLAHLRFTADGVDLAANPAAAGAPVGTLVDSTNETLMADYKIEYPLSSPPSQLRIEQDFLQEFDQSDASFTVRIRENDDPEFKTWQLHRDSHVEFNSHWNGGPTTNVAATGTRVEFWPTVRSFLSQGIWHILTGYDHLLFVSGLVLAAISFWDLVKVVFSFTLAHTITLALCVFNIVNLSSRIVEPMISASIMLVALQNIFYPKKSVGWTRMAIAFGFGLFHGLGFAGGLKDAMSEMPSMALWVALISFSLGVEIGHQLVVIPLYCLLRFTRKTPALPNEPANHAFWQRYGSCAICVAGGYFLVQALQGNT